MYGKNFIPGTPGQSYATAITLSGVPEMLFEKVQKYYLPIKNIAITMHNRIKPASRPACTFSFFAMSRILFIPDFLKVNNNQVFQEMACR